MGCNFAKTMPNDRKKQGNSTPIPDAVTPAPQDPRMPLNARQRFSITKSWKAISRTLEPTGVSMFVRFFQSHEDMLNLFEKFRELKTREEQSESMELAQHATVVMETLDESIMSLENVDYCIDYLHNVGKMHRKVAGFKSEYFWKMESPFLAAVQETLGDRYTENIENIYKITIHFILEHVVSGYDQADGGEANVKQNNV